MCLSHDAGHSTATAVQGTVAPEKLWADGLSVDPPIVLKRGICEARVIFTREGAVGRVIQITFSCPLEHEIQLQAEPAIYLAFAVLSAERSHLYSVDWSYLPQP